MTDPENDENWLEIDAFSNALDYLKKARIALSDGEDQFRWKWATIGLSSALYGFLICMLTGSTWERVVDMDRMPKRYKRRLEELGGGYWEVHPSTIDKETHLSRRKVIEDYLRSGHPRLIGFREALRWAQDPKFVCFFTHSKPLDLSESQNANIMKLRQVLRNEFEHFKPKSWGIEVGYFIPLLKDTLLAIEQAANSFNLRVGHRDDMPELRREIDELRKILERPLES